MEKAQRMSWAGWWAVMVNIKEYYTKDLDLILTSAILLMVGICANQYL